MQVPNSRPRSGGLEHHSHTCRIDNHVAVDQKDEVCSACDDTITTHQKIHEWEYDGAKIVMHLACYEIWNDERGHRGPGA